MALFFQILGFLAGGVILGRVAIANSGLSPRFPLANVGLAVAIVAAILFSDHVWQIGSGLLGSTRTASAVSSFVAQHAADPGANNTFLAWARKKMLALNFRDHGTYYLEPATVLKEPQLGQWSTYELLPERATAKLGEADWVVFYGVDPALTKEQRRQFDGITQFSPGYALALRSNAH